MVSIVNCHVGLCVLFVQVISMTVENFVDSCYTPLH